MARVDGAPGGREEEAPTRIAVVDRYPGFLALMEAVLSERTHTVIGLDVDEARIEDVAGAHPDLVIVGLGPLRGDPARRLLLEARRHPSLADVPFLAAGRGPSALPAAMAPDAVLGVPFDLRDLLITVEALVRARRSRIGAHGAVGGGIR